MKKSWDVADLLLGEYRSVEPSPVITYIDKSLIDPELAKRAKTKKLKMDEQNIDISHSAHMRKKKKLFMRDNNLL